MVLYSRGGKSVLQKYLASIGHWGQRRSCNWHWQLKVQWNRANADQMQGKCVQWNRAKRKGSNAQRANALFSPSWHWQLKVCFINRRNLCPYYYWNKPDIDKLLKQAWHWQLKVCFINRRNLCPYYYWNKFNEIEQMQIKCQGKCQIKCRANAFNEIEQKGRDQMHKVQMHYLVHPDIDN